MNGQFKYFNFPLYLLQLTILEDRRTALDKIISWSIVNYGNRLRLSDEEFTEELDYLYHRNSSELPEDIFETLDQNEHLLSEDPFKPRMSQEICNEGLINALKDFGEYESAELIVRIRLASRRLKVKPGSISLTYDNYNQAQDFLNAQDARFGKSPWVGIKTDYVFETRDGSFNLDLFRLLCSISSIIGKRKFNRTYKAVLVIRMLGAKSKDQVKELNLKDDFNILFTKYSIRYHIDKIINQAWTRNLISKIGLGRGLFLSIQYSDEELKNAIAKKHSEFHKKKIQELEARKFLKEFKQEKNIITTQ